MSLIVEYLLVATDHTLLSTSGRLYILCNKSLFCCLTDDNCDYKLHKAIQNLKKHC